VVLIALGLLFLLGQLDLFSGRLLEFTWPVLLIALGGWLLVRRLHDSSVASGPVSHAPSGSDVAAPSPGHERADSQNDSQGGSQ
jgi:ABC-type nickel/cobalt efflux system permease component RcnA